MYPQVLVFLRAVAAAPNADFGKHVARLIPARFREAPAHGAIPRPTRFVCRFMFGAASSAFMLLELHDDGVDILQM
jgi:hypothetical protein